MADTTTTTTSSTTGSTQEKKRASLPRRASRKKTAKVPAGGGPAKTTSRGSKRHNPLGSGSSPTKAKEATSSSMTTNDKKVLLETFRCSICLEPFFEPVTLCCGHNFCKLCSLGRLLRNCPLCNWEVKNPVGLKVNSTLKSLLQQFFPEEYASREEQWRKENEIWATEVLTALQGGKMLTEPELYEAFRIQFEKRASAADIPTRQQFLYFLSHLKKNGQLLALKGKPFLFMDPASLDLTNALSELRRRKEAAPPLLVSKRKWQANWVALVLQKLKEVDGKSYQNAKESADVLFDEFDTLDDFNETTPSSESPSSSSSTSGLPSYPYFPFGSLIRAPLPSDYSEDYSDSDSDDSDY